MLDKTLHIKLKIEKHEPHYKMDVNSVLHKSMQIMATVSLIVICKSTIILTISLCALVMRFT